MPDIRLIEYGLIMPHSTNTLQDSSPSLIAAALSAPDGRFEEHARFENSDSGFTNFMRSIRDSVDDEFQHNLRRDDVNGHTDSGKTALMYAAEKGNGNYMEELILAGADINLADQYGRTALHYATYYQQEESLDRLISSGADINAQDESGWSPLMIAASGEDLNAVQKLLENGADPNMVSYNGRSVLMVAAGTGNKEIVELLMEKGADVNLRSVEGTAAGNARYFGHDDLAEMLESRMDPLIRDNRILNMDSATGIAAERAKERALEKFGEYRDQGNPDVDIVAVIEVNDENDNETLVMTEQALAEKIEGMQELGNLKTAKSYTDILETLQKTKIDPETALGKEAQTTPAEPAQQQAFPAAPAAPSPG